MMLGPQHVSEAKDAMPELLKPALYQERGTPEVPDHPALLGGACACGYVFFPVQHFGCEKCGGTDIEPRVLSGTGRLVASARVHLHAGKGREAPFTAAAIALDDGPMVRTLLADDAPPLRPGQRMVTTLEPVLGPEGEPRLDLRFAPEVTR
jgi:uncharacterized OB-fold protein